MQLLEDNRTNVYGIGFGSEAKKQKKKIDKLDFMKTKHFCASKPTVIRGKRQPPEWAKYSQII